MHDVYEVCFLQKDYVDYTILQQSILIFFHEFEGKGLSFGRRIFADTVTNHNLRA